MMNKELLYNQLYERTKEFGRSHFVKEIMRLEREIEKLNKANRILEKSNIQISEKLNILKDWLKDEIYDIEETIKQGNKFLGDTKGNYTLRMNLIYRKNALIEVLKKMKELERGKDA